MLRKMVYVAICFFAVVMLIIAMTRQSVSNVLVVLPLTGPSAEFGKSVKRAMDQWLLSNTEKRFSLVYVDAESSPTRAVSAFREKAVSCKPRFVIVGPTYLANAVIPVADEMDVFVLPIATFFSALKDMDKYDNFQAVSMNINDSLDPIIHQLKKTNDKCSVIYSHDDFGLLSKNYFSGNYPAELIVSTYPFSPNDTTIRDVVAQCVKQEVPSVIVTGTTYPAYISAVKELLQQGFKGHILADIAYSNPFVSNAIGPTDAVSFVCTSSDFREGNTGEAIPYYEACVRLNEHPYFLSLQAWDVLCLIDYLYDTQTEATREAIVGSGYNGILHNLKFSSSGASNYACSLAKFKDGKLIKVE